MFTSTRDTGSLGNDHAKRKPASDPAVRGLGALPLHFALPLLGCKTSYSIADGCLNRQVLNHFVSTVDDVSPTCTSSQDTTSYHTTTSLTRLTHR